MKIIISPAKKLSCKTAILNKDSIIQFQEDAKYLVRQLRSYSVSDIKEMMGLSNSLAELNYERYKQWGSSDDLSHAIYMFQGDVYKGLRADTFTNDELIFAQDRLKIISGLYGLLRPLDLIYPYRLEMGTKIKTRYGKNLYEFWGDKLYNHLISDMQENEFLINLASNEYSKAVKLDRLKDVTITPVFKDYKNGKLKVISFFAKRARGEMVNFIVKNKLKNIEDLKLFSHEGYKFQEEDGGNLLYVR